MEYGTGQINYLGILKFKKSKEINYTFYVEINSKIKRKGFTKLLSPSGLDPFERLRNYSLAKYVNDTLAESYGNYEYKSVIVDTIKIDDLIFINQNGDNHLFYKLNKKEVFILSKPNVSLLSQIAPFAYLFTLILILTFILLIQFNKDFIFWKISQSFSFRLQVSFIVLIGISIILITWISIFYIKGLNSDKDLKTIKSTAISLQTEFEHKLANTVTENTNMRDYLNELSSKFAIVFSVDINLYSLDGELLTTTRPELFAYNLLSNKISPDALYFLDKKKEIYIVQAENIGKLDYFSAYMPFHDANNRVVAYLNIPYFAQQDKLSQEVSSFIMTLINAYIFIIFFSILAIILLSSYIIRPLKMIKEKMQKIRVGKQNDYINWNKNDEIGDLIEQYNKMVDKLAVSAELLAKSERESAWQQMAQQVAHEIKNPLTPMKLSLQYLMKAIDDGAVDWEDRLRKLSRTLIEQIDTLADIATAFSDFAKMPTNHLEIFDLKEALESSAKIFQDLENVEINIDELPQKYWVNADKNQMIRVYNNLIKNAIQSYNFNEKAKINIKIIDENENWKTIISDYGIGISEDEIDKIFIPNFTTKSGGMGLGLAMVKNIISNNNGRIEFETEIGKGTSFFVYLKKAENE